MAAYLCGDMGSRQPQFSVIEVTFALGMLGFQNAFPSVEYLGAAVRPAG